MGPKGTRRIRSANFDPVARIYRWAEYLVLGRLLERTRNHFLPEAAKSNRVWTFGDGDGRFTASLLELAPELTVVSVDGSAAMLHLLQQRCARHASRLHLVQADLRQLPFATLGPSPDLVVTHFFLDCLSSAEIQALARRLGDHLAPGGYWLLSDFAYPPRQPWRALGRLLIRSLYIAFGILTGLQVRQLPDISRALFATGFQRIHHASWCRGLLYSEIWQRESRPGDPGSAPSAQLSVTPPHPFSCD